MRLSRERLQREAATTGFRPAVLEKVFLLLDLLEAMSAHPALSGKLALKGGTALNLFLFDAPRLSVDIDLNYISTGNYVGAEEREAMRVDRPQVEQAVELITRRLGLTPQTPKKEQHAGRTWVLRYASALGGTDNLKIDLIYTLRLPLWTPARRDSRIIASRQIKEILVLDDHELAGGKLVALLARRTSRDLFDAHELLLHHRLDPEKLRLAFVVYGAMNPEDWRQVRAEDIGPATRDLDTYLRPLLRWNAAGPKADPKSDPGWEERLVAEVREALSLVLPLRANELAFLDRLLEVGKIEAELLTEDAALAQIIRRHPALLWKAQNVRSHKSR